jgi:hypothetical protein
MSNMTRIPILRCQRIPRDVRCRGDQTTALDMSLHFEKKNEKFITAHHGQPSGLFPDPCSSVARRGESNHGRIMTKGCSKILGHGQPAGEAHRLGGMDGLPSNDEVHHGSITPNCKLPNAHVGSALSPDLQEKNALFCLAISQCQRAFLIRISM